MSVTETCEIACPACDRPLPPPAAGARVAGYPLKTCGSCGLQALDPQPDDPALTRIYQQEYYDAWGLKDDEKNTAEMKRVMFRRLLKKSLGASPNSGRLLDCGAAVGYLMEEARDLGYDAYGAELSEYGAGEIALKFGRDRVFCGPFERAEFAGVDHDYFDVITMFDFIEHVRDPGAVLAKAARLLKPGGTLVLLTPNAGDVSRRLMGLNWLHYKAEHLYYFNPAAITSCLKRAGFGGVKVGRAWKTMTLHYVYHQLSRYPHRLLTPVLSLVYRLSPPPLRKAAFRVTFGELLATAVKTGTPA